MKIIGWAFFVDAARLKDLKHPFVHYFDDGVNVDFSGELSFDGKISGSTLGRNPEIAVDFILKDGFFEIGKN